MDIHHGGYRELKLAIRIVVVMALAAVGFVGFAMGVDASDDAGDPEVPTGADGSVVAVQEPPEVPIGEPGGAEPSPDASARAPGEQVATGGTAASTSEPSAPHAAQSNALVLLAIGTLGLCCLRKRRPAKD